MQLLKLIKIFGLVMFVRGLRGLSGRSGRDAETGRYPWLEQVTRQEQLVSGCAKHKHSDQIRQLNLDHVLVDHKHKLLYCYVPKVACTNWKRVFMVLTGAASVGNLVDIPGSVAHAENSTLRLSQLDDDEIKKVLEEYTAFVMVRHPFERLLSAFRNKFENTYSQYFQIRYGRSIIKKFRANPTALDLENGTNVTFHEFINFILDDGLEANEHWTPIYTLCHPCSLNYTFIGRYETLAEDARALLDMVGAPPLHFPYTRTANTSNRLRLYFQQLSMLDIQSLYKKYERDFKYFGYTLEDLLGFDLP